MDTDSHNVVCRDRMAWIIARMDADHMVNPFENVMSAMDNKNRPLCVEPENYGLYKTSAVVVLLLLVLHVYRLVWVMLQERMRPEATVREMVICAVAVIGLALFWQDVQRCRVMEGLPRFLFMEGVATVLVPCLWPMPPPYEDAEVRDDDEGEGRPPPPPCD